MTNLCLWFGAFCPHSPLRLKTYPSASQYTWGSKNVLQQPFSHLHTKNEGYQNKQKIMISNQQTNISSLTSFNFMVAVTICSDFGPPKNKVWHCFQFPHLFPMKSSMGFSRQSEKKMFTLGEAHWLKPPTLARHPPGSQASSRGWRAVSGEVSGIARVLC